MRRISQHDCLFCCAAPVFLPRLWRIVMLAVERLQRPETPELPGQEIGIAERCVTITMAETIANTTTHGVGPAGDARVPEEGAFITSGVTIHVPMSPLDSPVPRTREVGYDVMREVGCRRLAQWPVKVGYY